jgi:hypothetical protein
LIVGCSEADPALGVWQKKVSSKGLFAGMHVYSKAEGEFICTDQNQLEMAWLLL